MSKETPLEAAQVGKMFVTKVTFEYHEGGSEYNDKTGKYDAVNPYWNITANLRSSLDRYKSSEQSMSIQVEQGVGQKLAEVLLPVIVADASKKAQQLADDSKAMLEALGERTIQCISNMPPDTAKK